jgi:hypothetical protein
MANVNATLTCPNCAHHAHEVMPTDRCVVVYDCPACARTLRPKKGDCCVFCSYADRPCPSVQESGGVQDTSRHAHGPRPATL